MTQDSQKTLTAMDRARRAMQRAGKPYASQGMLEAIAEEIEGACRYAATTALAHIADTAGIEAAPQAGLCCRCHGNGIIAVSLACVDVVEPCSQCHGRGSV